MTDEERKQGLANLRARTREALRAGLANVKHLEPACDARELDAWIGREVERFGGRRVELFDEE